MTDEIVYSRMTNEEHLCAARDLRKWFESHGTGIIDQIELSLSIIMWNLNEMDLSESGMDQKIKDITDAMRTASDNYREEHGKH
jgi:hypothetical protein